MPETCYTGVTKRGDSHMANLQKFAKGNVKGLSIHLDRKTTNHSNKEIDVTKSHLNYDLCTKDGDTNSRLNERLNQVHCLNRKDVKVCATWVVTLPESLKQKSADEQRIFFEKTYDFLTDRYGGEQNVLSANVHNDETTPHMHFAFVPVVWDEKKQYEKVSAKEILNRKELQTFHQDLDTFLKRKIPAIYQEGILNGQTVDVANVKELKQFGDEIKREKQKMVKDLKAFKEPKKVLNKVEKSIKRGMFRNTVTMPEEDYERLRKLSLSVMPLNKRIENLNIEANSLFLEAKMLNKENQSLLETNKELSENVKKLEKAENDLILAKSLLKDNGQDLVMNESERLGRLIIDSFERGLLPKDISKAQEAYSVLEENKKAGTIPLNRLERVLEVLKAFIDELLRREDRFSLKGLKERSESLEREKKPKRNRDRGMSR